MSYNRSCRLYGSKSRIVFVFSPSPLLFGSLYLFFPLSLRVSSVGRARDIVVVFVAAILPSIYIYVVRMRCASTSIALPNDVERIGKVDRLKSIMLGDDREGPSLYCLRSGLISDYETSSLSRSFFVGR